MGSSSFLSHRLLYLLVQRLIPNSKHWNPTSFLQSGGYRKALLGLSVIVALSSFLIHRLLYLLVQRLTLTPTLHYGLLPPRGTGKRCSECGCGVVFIPYSPALVSSGPASDPNSNTAIRPPRGTGKRCSECGFGVDFIPYSPAPVSCSSASDPNSNTAIRPPRGTGKRCSECGCGVDFIPYSPAPVSRSPASDPNSNTAIRPPSSKGVGTAYRKAMLGAWLWGCLQSVPCPSMATAPPQKGPARVIKLGAGRVGGSHTPSIAFRHLPPNSARFSYATEGALFISAQLSSDAVSALRKVRLLI